MSTKVIATARIQCVVEVEVGRWYGNSAFDELHDQVAAEGLRTLSSMRSTHGAGLKVIGEPTVVMVTMERPK